MELLEGSTAIAESAIAAGCRFFAGYPMSPFTGLLESMAQRLPAAGAVAQTKRMLRKAFECQLEGRGFGLVEILTMCPTGWFVTAPDGPTYLEKSMEKVYPIGELVGA